MEPPVGPSSTAKFRVMLSERMRPTVLVVTSRDSNTSRTYHFRRASADGTALLFRCRRCEYLNRVEPVSGRRYKVNIHVQSKQMIYLHGEEHHPSCVAEPNGQVMALEINRKHKARVRSGLQKPFAAWTQVNFLFKVNNLRQV